MAPAVLVGAKIFSKKVLTTKTPGVIIGRVKGTGHRLRGPGAAPIEMEETKMNKRYTLDWLTKKDLENLMRGLQLLTELNNAKGKDSRENELLLPLIDKIVESTREGK